MAPPQHGKSKAVQDFVAWCAGINPDLKVIFTSYSDDLGARANVALQRAIRSPIYKGIFGRTVIGIDSWVCNQSLIEYVGYKGSEGGAVLRPQRHRFLGALCGQSWHGDSRMYVRLLPANLNIKSDHRDVVYHTLDQINERLGKDGLSLEMLERLRRYEQEQPKLIEHVRVD